MSEGFYDSKVDPYLPDYKRPTGTYFIRHGEGGPIKIGRTTDVRKRLLIMQCCSPVLYTCIAYIEHDVEDELHEMFDDLCINGEWFHPDQRLLDFIRRNAVPCCMTSFPPTPEQKRVRRAQRLRTAAAVEARRANLPPHMKSKKQRPQWVEA